MSNPTTYDDCLDAIRDATDVNTQLTLIELLPELRGENNPNYAKGLSILTGITNETVKTELSNEIYTFGPNITEEEISLFDYFKSGYVESNPGQYLGVFSSYVGVYINEDEEYTGQFGSIEPVYPGNFVISFGGVWNDEGIWKDEEVWVDGE